MKKEVRTIEIENLEIRSGEEGKTTIAGYAARFEKLSVPLWGFREKIRAGAFSGSLTNNIKALWNHNSDLVLGSTKGGSLVLEEDEKGLRFELDLPDTTWGRDAAESIRRKDVDGVSFGFRTKRDEWDETNPKDVVRTLIDVELLEISPTPFPAYPSTNVGVRSTEDVFNEFITQRGAEDKVAGEERQAQARRVRELQLLELVYKEDKSNE